VFAKSNDFFAMELHVASAYANGTFNGVANGRYPINNSSAPIVDEQGRKLYRVFTHDSANDNRVGFG